MPDLYVRVMDFNDELWTVPPGSKLAEMLHADVEAGYKTHHVPTGLLRGLGDPEAWDLTLDIDLMLRQMVENPLTAHRTALTAWNARDWQRCLERHWQRKLAAEKDLVKEGVEAVYGDG